MDVALGCQLHEVGGERHDQENVDAQFLDELGAAGQRGQLRWMAAREDDFHGMRVERHQYRRHSAGPARLDRVIDQLGVSAVHPVEHADRHERICPSLWGSRLAPASAAQWQAYGSPGGPGCAVGVEQLNWLEPPR